MNPLLCVEVFIATSLAASIEDVNADIAARVVSGRELDSEPLCGANSLLVVAQLMEMNTTWDEVSRAIRSLSEQATLLDLKAAAEALRIPCAAVRWRTEMNFDLPTPAIIAINTGETAPNHYVVVSSRVGDRYQVLDFGRRPALLSEATLRSRWNGYALHFAKHESELAGLQRLADQGRWQRILRFVVCGVAVVSLIVTASIARRKNRSVSIQS